MADSLPPNRVNQLHKLPLSGIWVADKSDDENRDENGKENGKQNGDLVHSDGSDPSTFTLYEDVDGNIMGYTDAPHICNINGKIQRYEDVTEWISKVGIRRTRDLKVKHLQSTLQIEQQWTEHSNHGADLSTVSVGVLDDDNEEIVMEYVSKSNQQNIVTHRGRSRLRRLDRSSEIGCLSGTWRLYKKDYTVPPDEKNKERIKNTVHFVENEVDSELLSLNRKETIFDIKEEVPIPLPGPCGVPPPSQMMFIPQDSYESIIRQHAQTAAQEEVTQELKHKKVSQRQKYRDCIDLTHFKDDHIEGQCTFNRSLCTIRGRVFRESKKFIFVQNWRSQRGYRSRYHRKDANDPDLYPCITRVIGHYDPSCTRLCCTYCLLYPLGLTPNSPISSSNASKLSNPPKSTNPQQIASELLSDIIDSILSKNTGSNPMDIDDDNENDQNDKGKNGKDANDESSKSDLNGIYKLERTENGDNILIIGRERFLILKQGQCLYFRDYNPHCDLSIPFYDEFYDRSREMYAHSRHFASDATRSFSSSSSRSSNPRYGFIGGGRRHGVRMMPHCEGTTHFAAYHPDHNILILGEADFSFTLGLLRAASRDAFGKDVAVPLGDGCIVGTSYLCRRGPTKSVYGPQPEYVVDDPIFRQFLDEGPNGELFNILHEIWRRKGRTFHGVDCRKITETLRSQLGADPLKFDRIVFPFPRASLLKYDEDLDHDLIGGLFKSAQQELSPNGELHIILHTNRDGINQFDIWSIRDLAERQGMIWRAALPFDWRSIPPYHPKDVKNQQWKPYIATIHVFTPNESQWNPQQRCWRPKGEKWDEVMRMHSGDGMDGVEKEMKGECNGVDVIEDKDKDIEVVPKSVVNVKEEEQEDDVMAMLIMPKPASVRLQSMALETKADSLNAK